MRLVRADAIGAPVYLSLSALVRGIQLESNPSSALKALKLLIARLPENRGIPRLTDMSTNRVLTIPRIPEPPTASPSNPVS